MSLGLNVWFIQNVIILQTADKIKEKRFSFQHIQGDHSNVKRGTIEPGGYAAQITRPLIGLRNNKHYRPPLLSLFMAAAKQ
jgi:hypothetical protein